jgi:hypothetical protein
MDMNMRFGTWNVKSLYRAGFLVKMDNEYIELEVSTEFIWLRIQTMAGL